MSKNKLRRDVYEDAEAEIWHMLKYGKAPKLRIERRGAYDANREPGSQHYVDYIVTNKPTDQIDWEK